MKRIVLVLVLLVVLCLGAALSYYNWSNVPFNFLAGEAQVPLIALLLGVFTLGVIVALLLCAGRILGLRADLHRLKRQLADTQTEIRNLRNLPLQGSPD